jgi:hypothetical protein
LPAATATPGRSLADFLRSFLPVIAGGAGVFTATPTPTSTPTVDSFTLIDRDLASGRITIDQAAIYKIYALFASPDLPPQYQSNVLIPTDGLGAFATAIKDWNQLLPATQQTITDFLTPRSLNQGNAPANTATTAPMATATRTATRTATATSTATATRTATPIPVEVLIGCTFDRQFVSRNGNFVIRYSSATSCQIISALGQNGFLQALGDGLEDAYRMYHQTLGYNAPANPPYKVYIGNVRSIVFPTHALALRDKILFDRNNGSTTANAIAVDAAHEYFHLVQWSYQSTCTSFGLHNGITDAWFNNDDLRSWMEATATWAQHVVYPTDTSHFGLVRTYLDSPWKRLDYHYLWDTAPAYGRFIFPTYLAERFQNDSIRQTWARYQQVGNCRNIIPAIDQVVNLGQVFPDFVRTNYFLDYAEENAIRSNAQIGANYRPFRAERPLDHVNTVFNNNARLPRDANGNGVTIDHLGAAYLDFTRVLSQPNQSLIFEVTLYTNGSTPAANVYAITQYSPTVYSVITTTTLSQVSSTQWRLSGGVANFANYEQVTVVVYNPGLTPSSDGITFDYRAVLSRAALYAGRDANGYVSANGGGTWNKFTFPNNVTIQAVAAITNTQGLVGYMGTSDLKLWKTTNAGVTFNPIYDFTSKVQGYITNTALSLITVDPTNSNVIYVEMRGKAGFWDPDKGALYKSTDGGQTFGSDLLAHCHTNHNPGDWQDCAITSLAIDRRAPNVLWIGQNGWNATAQALMRSVDGGQTWQSVKSIMNTFTSVTMSPINPSVIWILSQEQLSGQWVYRTSDGGLTWNSTKIDNTLNPADRTILADPFNVYSAYASGGGVGLQRSQDSNLSWQAIGSEFSSLGTLSPQVLYGMATWPTGIASVQVFFTGGTTWINIGHPDMIGGGTLSVVSP